LSILGEKTLFDGYFPVTVFSPSGDSDNAKILAVVLTDYQLESDQFVPEDFSNLFGFLSLLLILWLMGK
jgi:hypothetical protein